MQSAPAATILFDVLLAGGLVSMGRFDEAEGHLDRLAKEFERLDADPIPVEKALFVRKYQLIRANCLRGKNQPIQAMALAHAVATGTTVTPQEASIALEAWSFLADTCISLGRWAEAADAFEKAVELAPQSPRYPAMATLAAVRIVQDRTDEAISLYRRALPAEPQNTRLLNNLATLLSEQPGHAKEALEFIDRAIHLAGPQSWLRETKGAILLGDGRVDEALAMLKESASSAEPDPRALLHLAQAYRLAGKLDQARTALDDAHQRNLPQQLLTPAERKLVKELDEKLRR